MGSIDSEHKEIESQATRKNNFLSPKDFSKRVDFWEKIYESEQNDLNRFYSLDMIERKDAVFKLLNKHRRQPPYKILDVGCGPGVFLRDAASLGHQVIGVDGAEAMVRKAEENLRKQGLTRARVFQADIENLPFPDNSFDIVLCIGVLSYLSSDDEALKEIRRVVRKNGMVILGLPNQLRLAQLFDPIYYLHFVTYIKKKRRRDRKGTRSTVSIDNFRRYLFWQLPGLFMPFGLSILDIIPVGFGPLTIWLKEFLDESLSLKLRQFLIGQSAKSKLCILKVFANHWVICLKKDPL